LVQQQRLIANALSTTTQQGALFFDADGTGESEQVQLATLSSGLALGNADIFIF
jgi:hypothetical protein